MRFLPDSLTGSGAGLNAAVTEVSEVEEGSVPSQVQHAGGLGAARPHPAPAQGHHH